MRFLTKPPKHWTLAILVGISVLTSLLGRRVGGNLRQSAQLALAPLGSPGMYLATAFKSRFGDPQEVPPQEAMKWRREVRMLRMQVTKLQEELKNRQDIRQFRRTYAPSGEFPWELVPARVVGADSLTYGQTRVVKIAGTNAGAGSRRVLTVLTDRSTALPPGWATVTASALVGEVIESGTFTARIRLVADRGFSTDAMIRRVIDGRTITVTKGPAAMTKLTAQTDAPIPVTVRGDGGGGLIVEDVKADHNVKPGDSVVTWRDSVFLPAEVPIGRVSSVVDQPDKPGFVTVHAAPLANLNALREVYIVVPVGTESGRNANP